MELLGPDSVDTAQSHTAQLSYLESIGCILGCDAPGTLAIADHSPHGPLEVIRHPEVELMGEPELWPTYNAFRLGILDTITPAEYEEATSGFEVDCMLSLRHARMREEDRLRRLRESKEGHG